MLALTPFILWRIYSRFRRAVGRQRLSKYRAPITLTLFGLILIAVGTASWNQPWRLMWLAGAFASGACLGVYGLQKTRFEPTRQGLFYTPCAPLGIALALLFVARVAYRLFEVYVSDPGAPRSPEEFSRSPLTLAVFGLLAGYYMCYAIGLARWRARVIAAKRLREERAASSAPSTPNSK